MPALPPRIGEVFDGNPGQLADSQPLGFGPESRWDSGLSRCYGAETMYRRLAPLPGSGNFWGVYRWCRLVVSSPVACGCLPCRGEYGGRLPLVLLLTDVFQPVHGFAVEGFGDGDVGEGGGGGGAVPVFFAGREPDDVAGVDGFHGAAEALDAAGAGGDDEGLAEGMGVPGGAGAGLKGDDGAADAGGVAAFEGRVDADGAGEPVGGAFGGGLGAVAFDFHGVSLVPVGRIVYRPNAWG